MLCIQIYDEHDKILIFGFWDGSYFLFLVPTVHGPGSLQASPVLGQASAMFFKPKPGPAHG